MGELEKEYGERVEFVIKTAAETQAAQDDIVAFGFVEKKHGLVVFTPAGEPGAKLAGHDYGKDEIRAAIESVLSP